MNDPVRLSITIDAAQLQQLEDRIAARVLERVKAAELERLHTVSEIAAMFNVDETWVRRHQRQLGGYQLGNGHGRSPLRFKASVVQRFLDRHQLKPPASAGDWALGPNERTIG